MAIEPGKFVRHSVPPSATAEAIFSSPMRVEEIRTGDARGSLAILSREGQRIDKLFPVSELTEVRGG